MPDDDPDDSPEVAAPDDLSALFQFLNAKLNPEDVPTAEELVGNLLDSFGTNVAADRRRFAGDTSISKGTTMDLSIVKAWQELQAAEAETGLMGLDSAAKTYRAAIRQLGHDIPMMPANGMRTAWLLAKRKATGKPRAMAADSKTISARNEMFPNADRLLNQFR